MLVYLSTQNSSVGLPCSLQTVVIAQVLSLLVEGKMTVVSDWLGMLIMCIRAD